MKGTAFGMTSYGVFFGLCGPVSQASFTAVLKMLIQWYGASFPVSLIVLAFLASFHCQRVQRGRHET